MLDTLLKNLFPLNDNERVAALEKLEILYTASEEAFDNITHIMAQVYNTPMAFISLVDKDKVFYKSQVGPFVHNQVDRVDSLCSLTILSTEPLVIENAGIESCFKNNPFVDVEGGIRFYAGAPLITKDGHHIGAVCIIDTKPRTFSADDTALLLRFSSMVMHEIEGRSAAFRHREIREELKKAQLQLDAALEVGKVTPWVVDLVSGKVFGKAELAKMFGVNVNDAIKGLPLEIFVRSIHHDDQQYFWDKYNEAVQHGTNFEAEYRVFNIDKVEHWVIVRGSIKFDKKVPSILTGILIDITEKKKTEQEVILKNAELANLYQELRFVTDTIPQLAWIRDKDGAPLYFNQGWLDYTKLTYEELFENVISIVHPEDSEKVRNAWKNLEEFGERYQLEYRLKRHDGEYRWFLGRGRPLKDTEGTILKWYGTSTDINEQKMASQLLEKQVDERTKELLEANNNLKVVNAEMEQFSYVSHHDLQESIRKITIYTDWVQSQEENNIQEESRIRLGKVIESARRMSGALKDVLNYASLSKAEQFVKVNLNEILASVVLDLELVIEEKQATINNEHLPTINAVPQQMQQLLYNLVNNALKFSNPERQPVIAIKCRKLDNIKLEEPFNYYENNQVYWQISIQDNGIGFDQKFENKIFDIFQRLHGKQAYAGTGIGLALCRKVVLNHKGTIGVVSKEGEGTTFTIVLPEKG